MPFFFEVAKKISCHLSGWGENWMLKASLDWAIHRDQAMLEYIQTEMLRLDYNGWPRYDARARGPTYRAGDATAEFAESWTYPSQDWIRWRDRQYPYDRREAPTWIRSPSDPMSLGNMWNWQGHLMMTVKSGGQTFLVALHYNPLPWNTPRFMQKHLGDYAQHLRSQGEAEAPGRRQVEREFLQDLEEIDPETGERVWHIFTEADAAIETLHAQLVIFAWHQGFPVESDDEKLAIAFIRHLVRQTAWSSNPADIEEFTSECLTHLIQHFHTPSSSLFLAAYIRRHVQTMIARKRRDETYESFKPANGTAHSVPQAIMRIQSEMQHAFGPEFMDCWVPSERTIYDWIKVGKIETQKTDDSSIVLTEQGLQTAIALAQTRNARRRALARGEARGLSRDRTEQIIHRNRSADGDPDWQLIDEKIDAGSPSRTRARTGKPKARR